MDPVIDLQTPASAISDAPAQPVAPTQDPLQPAIAAVPQAPATGAPQEGWVPSYRLREAGEAATRRANAEAARQIEAIRAESEQYKRQLHSLVGVQAPPDPQISAVRQQFGTLYPGLTKLEAQAEKIEAMLSRTGELENQSNHYWQSHGRQAMDRLFTHAAESLGGPLNDEAKRALHASFVGFVQSSPELSDRYANDPTLVEDFWKAFSSSFIDPARRAAATGVLNRAPGSIPQDTPGGAPRATPAPQPADLNERASNAWAMYQTSANKNIR